ncbi:MAG: low molecular weight phosphotyrosine protein phosphatase [Bacteroidales bacterium]|nr:low molecular weight phosphotyrosine protein phosphatase [Bacteroidales bacterium]
MKILFLCLANTCRSPLAEGILRKKLKSRNLTAEVDSAGFEAYHINEPPDKRAVKTALEQGIDISDKRARLFTTADFDRYDKIFVMDSVTYRNALYFTRNDDDISKVDFVMNVLRPGRNEPVPDPFHRNLDASDQTFTLLDEACDVIADMIARDSS